MITPENLIDAAKTLLSAVLPGEKPYSDYVPKDFERPSSLAVLKKYKAEPDIHGTARVTAVIELTSFVKTDEYHNSHFPDLAGRGMKISRALSAGYLPCGDRALHIAKTDAESFYDSTVFMITLDFWDDYDGSGDDSMPIKDVSISMEAQEWP